jgi:hypothetical protein
VTLRGIPGALVLGLLASLVAHSALYGGGHAMGGAYHAWFLELATAGCLGLLASIAALAWTGSRAVADGSVLAARLSERLPNGWAAFSAAGAWFALGERIETRHADPSLLVTALVLALAAWAVVTLARCCIRLLAGAAIAVARSAFAQRSPQWIRLAAPAPIARRSPLLRRRFARPPPVANACA